jgi:hypothetical protein
MAHPRLIVEMANSLTSDPKLQDMWGVDDMIYGAIGWGVGRFICKVKEGGRVLITETAQTIAERHLQQGKCRMVLKSKEDDGGTCDERMLGR